MSSMKRLSAEKYSATPFFRFTLRHNLQHLALYLVIAVLLMVLPAMIIINDFSDRLERSPEWNYYNAISNDMLVVAGLGVLVAGSVAVLSGMATASYVNSKTSVGCYHSFPLKREVILGCESLTRVIYFAVTMLFGYTVPYLMLLASLPTAGVLMGSSDYWLLALASVFVFLIVYSLFLFAGGLTGNGVTRLLMAGLIVCLPTALYALIITLAAVNSEVLYDSYYLNENILRKIFVPVRGYYGVYDLLEEGSIGLLLTTLIDTVFYTTGAFFLQKYRRSEHSGTSIIWKPVFMIVKLAVIVVCALFGAWFFAAAMGMSETLALFMGAIIGGVLAFIVSNCILYRSSRAMFRGLKSFGITMAAIFVFIVIVPLNAAGLIGKFYPASATEAFIVRMNPYGAEITYDEKEDIEMLHRLLTDGNNMFSGNTYPEHPRYNPAVHSAVKCLDDDYKNTYEVGYKYDKVEDLSVSTIEEGSPVYTLYVVQKPKLGIPLAVRVTADVTSIFTDTVTETEEFMEAMNIADQLSIDDVVEAEIRLDGRSLYFYRYANEDLYNISYDHYGEYSDLNAFNMLPILEEVIKNARYNPEYRKNSPVVGQINVYYETDGFMETNVYASRAHISLPVYACDTVLLEKIGTAMSKARFHLNMPDSEEVITDTGSYYRNALDMAGVNRVILLVNCRTGEYAEIDRETLLELADYTSSFISSASYFAREYETVSDSDYMIIYQRETVDDIEIRFRRGTDIDAKLESMFKG